MKTTFLCSLLMLIAGLATAAETAPVKNPNLILLPVPNDPAISVRLWFKVGSQNDPVGKEGLALLTAQMLTSAATTTHSYEQVLEKLYPLAASYGASVSTEMTVISGRVHKDNLEAYTPLLVDAVLHPAFRQEDLDRIRSAMLNYLENTLRYGSDEDLGKAILSNDIFAGTPYGHLTHGTVAGVRSVTLEDVKRFYASYYTRYNLVVGIGGGFPEAFVTALTTALGSLPETEPVTVPPPAIVPVRGLRVTLVEKEAPATAMSLGFPIDLLRGSRAWYALAIANSWLGEHRNSSSHLYQVIRETRGLNYGDYSYIENFPNGGRLQMPPQNVCRRRQLFEIWIRPVPNETRHFVLRAAVRELQTLVDHGMRREDFDLTRRFLKKYVLHYAPTAAERLAYALDDRFYGIDGSHLELFRKMMDELSLDEVNAAIRKYWQTTDMTIAVVTKDAEAFRQALVADAASPISYKGSKAESVLAEDKIIGAYPLKVLSSNIRIVPVADLFAR